jgi:xanthine dehydrogenase YagT iron-sulfur-binding subunit
MAVEPRIEAQFFPKESNPENVQGKLGTLQTACRVSYFVFAPLFGWLSDRRGRWGLLGVGGILWSLASGGSGLAAASAVLTGPAEAALDEAREAEAGPKILSGQVPITLKINGQQRECTVEPRSTLLDTLRNRLDVTGPKRVCDRASCGACTTIIDGDPVYSCTTLAVSCQGKTIETPEGFGSGEKSVPHAFHQNDALMCGYCTPGFVTACEALLRENPDPTLEEVKRGLDGNICRCGTYIGVFRAALAAATAKKGD